MMTAPAMFCPLLPLAVMGLYLLPASSLFIGGMALLAERSIETE
jgi:hypothetical protein